MRLIEVTRTDRQILAINPERVIIIAPVDDITTELCFAPNFAIRVLGNYKKIKQDLEGVGDLIKL